ncbi:hypothetical protein Tco_0603743 [Tanacetum coccineum]
MFLKTMKLVLHLQDIDQRLHNSLILFLDQLVKSPFRICLTRLKTQLADAQAEAESSRSYAQKLFARKKMASVVKVGRSARILRITGKLEWAVKDVEVALVIAEEEVKAKLVFDVWMRSFNPHMLCRIAERRLLKHGLRFAAYERFGIRSQASPLGCCECALALVKAEGSGGRNLHEKEVSADSACRQLEEAGDAAYQVGSSEQSRCHSI